MQKLVQHQCAHELLQKFLCFCNCSFSGCRAPNLAQEVDWAGVAGASFILRPRNSVHKARPLRFTVEAQAAVKGTGGRRRVWERSMSGVAKAAPAQLSRYRKYAHPLTSESVLKTCARELGHMCANPPTAAHTARSSTLP